MESESSAVGDTSNHRSCGSGSHGPEKRCRVRMAEDCVESFQWQWKKGALEETKKVHSDDLKGNFF